MSVKTGPHGDFRDFTSYGQLTAPETPKLLTGPSAATLEPAKPSPGKAAEPIAIARPDIAIPPELEPRSGLERLIIRPIAFFVRLSAGIIMLALWLVVVGPIWFALLLRTIAAFSVATVLALFTSATPPHVRRLDAVVELWVSGFQKIFATISGTASNTTPPIPIETSRALLETGLAILLYGGLFTYLWILAAMRIYLW